MKNLLLVFALLVWTTSTQAQAEEKNGSVKAANTQMNENAAKGQEISNLATTTEGGKEKGMSISSAARRSTMMRERAEMAAENSEAGRGRAEMGAENSAAGRERAAMGAGNAERGRGLNDQPRPNSTVRPELPSQARPNVNIPQSRPNVPVGRPNTPAPNRPTPPGGRPAGLPGGGGI